MTARRRMRQSIRQERATAKQLGGGRTPGSGSGDEKGDGRITMLYRIENKGTAEDSYRLRYQDWDKLWGEAVGASERPIFHIRLSRDAPFSPEYVVLETCFVEELLDTVMRPVDLAPTKGIRIQHKQKYVPKFEVCGIQYRRTLLLPVRRRKPHDVMVLPWLDMKELLSDYSNKS